MPYLPESWEKAKKKNTQASPRGLLGDLVLVLIIVEFYLCSCVHIHSAGQELRKVR